MGGGACMAGRRVLQGGMYGNMRGMGVCVAWGMCVAGGMFGRGHVWWEGHVWQGACIAGRACIAGGMHGGGCMPCMAPGKYYEIQ